MVNSQFKSMMKSILLDKTKEIQVIFGTRLSEFLTDLIAYLAKHSQPVKKTILSKNKIKTKNLVAILEKLIAFKKQKQPSTFSEDILGLLNIIFCCCFHPKSTKSNRRNFENLFLELLDMCEYEKIFFKLKSALFLLIPYYTICISDNEKNMIEKIVPDKSVQVLPGIETVEACDICDIMENLIGWLKKNWNSKGKLCIDIFYDLFLRVYYPKFAKEAGFQKNIIEFERELDTKQSFEIIHNFLKVLFDQKENYDFSLFFTDSIKMKFFIQFLANEFKNTNLKRETYWNISRTILNDNKILNLILNESTELFLEFANTTCRIITDASQPTSDKIADGKTISSAVQFLSEFFIKMIELFNKKIIIKEITKLFHKHQYEKISSPLLLFSFIHSLMSIDSVSQDLLTCLTSIAIESEIYSAAACKYAQYLAILAFPECYEIDKEKVTEISNVLVQKMIRINSNLSLSYNFITKHMNQILNSPEEYVQKICTIKWNYNKWENDKINNTMMKLPIPKLMEKNDLIDKIKKYLDAFHVYHLCESNEQINNSFSPIFSFCEAFISMRELPLTIKYNRTIVLTFCFNQLVFAVLYQKSKDVRRNAFSLIAKILTYGDLKEHIDSDNLFQIYICNTALLLSPIKEDVNIGFSCAFNLIRHGYSGASSFIPILLNLVEENMIDINKDLIDFLSSISLFIDNITIEKRLIDEYIKVKDPSVDEKFLTNPGKNMYQRVLNIVDKLPRKWDLIISIYSMILSHELNSANPNTDNIQNVFKQFISAIKSKSKEAIIVVRTSEMYLSKLIKKYSSIISNFMKEFTDYCVTLTLEDDNSLIFLTILTLYEFFIYSKSEKIEAYQKFINFLVKVRKEFTSVPEIAKLSDDLLIGFGVFNRNYPFPNGINFPMVNEVPLDGVKGELFGLQNGNIIKLIPDPENNEKSNCYSFTQFGHYKWNFSTLPIQSKTNNNPSISIPLSHSLSVNEDNRMFLSNINSFYDKYNNIYGDRQMIEIDNSDKEINDILIKMNTLDNLPTITPKSIDIPIISDINNIPSAVETSLFSSENIFNIQPERTSLLKLKKMTKETHRSQYKVGILYVGKRTLEQNEIFSTKLEETSQQFQDFLLGLGWQVDLATHVQYDGGLTYPQSGKTSIYYSDFSNELMFHVSPLMLNDESNEQQIGKKRYIGNDHIHIIWSDNISNYDISTITSSFNQEHIVIYPIDYCLFRVDIFSQKSVGYFGPLHNYIICSKKELPSLVRATVISSMDTIYRGSNQFISQFDNINLSLNEVWKNNQPNENDKNASNALSIQDLMIDKYSLYSGSISTQSISCSQLGSLSIY